MLINKKSFLKVLLGFVFLLILVVIVNSNKEEGVLVLEEENNTRQPEEMESINSQLHDEAISDPLVVDIKGAVNNPGVYEITAGSRVIDVIESAGGMTEEADTYSVNLAELVYDEMSIVIFKVGEEQGIWQTEKNNKIRINSASKEELQSLSGIGPSKAEAIIQYREENGPFQTIEDLTLVTGIGEKIVEKIKDDILIR
ncbi:competence protein ComEA [Salirhabdus euzebyi]|uniref:Competence protein ComEA n=1 Tax=Salirhabdus euzebyi TaxID=394506 RepID=A0A841Q7E0_9BACI|nr:helix-hairpin-helix domain-containing protein [Salirhabdus euzebyi]MBB6454341.1 competence protein ComEA [Salirhabdus euzebyi]